MLISNRYAGTAPAAGVDIEPNFPTQEISNVSFVDCVASGNSGPGFAFYIAHFTATTAPFSLRLVNYSVTSGRHYGIAIDYIAPGIRGEIEVSNCSVSDTQFGALAIIDKAAGDSIVRVHGGTFDASASIEQAQAPVHITTAAISVIGDSKFAVGGVILEGIAVRDNRSRPWLVSASRPGTNVQNVSGGGIQVHNPHGCTESGPLHLGARCV